MRHIGVPWSPESACSSLPEVHQHAVIGALRVELGSILEGLRLPSEITVWGC